MNSIDTAVRVTVTVAAPLERAFRTFTERWNEWWPKTHRLGRGELVDVVLEPRAGGRWYERTAEGAECEWGRVLVWDPPRHVALSWRIGVGFREEPDESRASRIDVRFAEDGGGRTTVSLVHSAFERHGAGWESMREGVEHENGWPGILRAYADAAES